MSDKDVQKLLDDMLKKNTDSIRAALAYLAGVASTGHVKPTPPFPKKDEIARVVYGIQVFNLVIAAWSEPRASDSHSGPNS